MEILKSVVGIVLTSALVSAVVTALAGQWAAVRQARRARYSDVVATLVARMELPYRIRRRTDDEPATLATIRDMFHTSQERVVVDQAWVAADSAKVLEAWKAVRDKLDPWVRDRAQEAWTHDPITGGAAMNLEPPLPPPDIDIELANLQSRIAGATRWWKPW